MKAHVTGFLVLVGAWMPVAASPQTPFSGATEPGVPFPLPQNVDQTTQRRTGIGESNSLAISWDGRLIIYIDEGSQLWQQRPEPNNTHEKGFVFATFDPDDVTIPIPGGPPSFSGCFGTPYPRFAEVADHRPPNVVELNNTYPSYPGYTQGAYPYIGATAQGVGTMGELGL